MHKRYLALAAAVTLTLAIPAVAQHAGGPGHGGAPASASGPRSITSRFYFHGRDFNHLSVAERERWLQGEWRHAWYGGVFGWWWFVDGQWYPYPEPIYPYPTYITSPVIVDQAPAAPRTYWYRCANPSGYYPYVQACPGGWETVPAQPQETGSSPKPSDRPANQSGPK